MVDKRIAVMQPYIFPYIGYFQLIDAVDEFVFYDDVNFIRQGWINRNNLLVKGDKSLFTVPLKNISSFKSINRTKISESLYGHWRLKFLKKIQESYGKAPYYDPVYELIERVLNAECDTIADLAIISIKEITNYLGLSKKFILSSKNFGESKGFEKSERLKMICKQQSAIHYINPAGGRELYNAEDFLRSGIALSFLEPIIETYSQFDNEFVPYLSIIDVLMFNSSSSVNSMLKKYELK